MRTIYELMNLQGRIALVTGAGGHIGRIIALTLAEMGAQIILVDLPGVVYGTLLDELKAANTSSHQVRECDLESEESRSRLIASLAEDFRQIDILVNNAAFVGTSDLQGWAVPMEKQALATWRRALEVNLTAVFDLIKSLSPLLYQSPHASVINIASIYGVVGPDYSLYEGTDMGNPAAYAASKGGLIQLTRWLAASMAPRVRLNAISPGGVARNQPQSFVQRYQAKTPLNRMATEEDFKGAVAFLASDSSAYVTGQNLMVDGGWSIL